MYLVFANEKVTPEALFNAHSAAALERATAESEVLVIHDTTEFRFGDGMGWLNSEYAQGFLAHFSICAPRDGRPLGSVALHAEVRQGSRLGRKRLMPDLRNPDRESRRWQDAALLTAERLHGKADVGTLWIERAINLELVALIEHDQRFVVRLADDRRLESRRGRSDNPMLSESLSGRFARAIRIFATSSRNVCRRAPKSAEI